MTPKQVLEEGLREVLKDAKGNAYQLRLKPGLSQTQIEAFEQRLAVPLPKEARDLLAFSSGFDFEPFGEVNFFAREKFGLEEMFPCGLPMAKDDCGNEWVLDIRNDTGYWGPVLFVSHDPPVAVIQARDVSTFIKQILDLARPDVQNTLNYVTGAAVDRIWGDDPYLQDVHVARSSSDALLSEFSKQLPEKFWVADLRSLEIGIGFTWWRSGSAANLKRCDSELIFGVEAKVKKSLFSHLVKRICRR